MPLLDVIAELVAHLEIAFNGMPHLMILGVPTVLRLRNLSGASRPDILTTTGASIKVPIDIMRRAGGAAGVEMHLHDLLQQ